MILDIEFSQLSCGDTVIRLTKQETIVLAELTNGRVATHGRLISLVYGDRETDAAEISIKVIICRIRRKVRSAGWRTLISSQYAVGFFLTHRIDVKRHSSDVVIPDQHRVTLQRLLQSHPDHVAADRVLASLVGV